MTFSMKRSAVPLVLLATFVLAVGCKSGIDPQGRYTGTLSRSGNRTPVVANVPALSTSSEGLKGISFRITQPLATAKGAFFSIRILNRSTAYVSSDFLPKSGLSLEIDGKCAERVSANFRARGCLGEGTIQFTYQDRKNKSNDVALSLKLDRAGLPEDRIPNSPRSASSLDELLGRAKYLGYSSQQEAERVSRARNNIGVARGALLPRLSFRSVMGVVSGDLLSAIGDLVPFIFPSRWYRMRQAESLFEAERRSFASLRGNEMIGVHGLYFLILRDQELLSRLENHLAWMRSVEAAIAAEEQAGTMPAGSVEIFASKISQLQADKLAMETLVQSELMELSHAVALPALDGIIALRPIDASEITIAQKVEPRSMLQPVLAKSFELKSLDFLLKAAGQNKDAVSFGFLDPDGRGLGFERPFEIRVAESEKNEIRIKISETRSIIELRLGQVALEHNLSIDAFTMLENSAGSIKRQVRNLLERRRQGDDSLDGEKFLEMLVEINEKLVEVLSNQATYQQRWLGSKAKLDRLNLTGYYSTLDLGI